MTQLNSLANAKRNKNDEFYTKYEDIDAELGHYRHCLMGKRVYCNCDDPWMSNFWKYLFRNFSEFDLESLIASGINNGVYYEYDGVFTSQYSLDRDAEHDAGDFRSESCVDLLKSSDVVITNPPFSLFREYLDLLLKYDKLFLVISNLNSVMYESVFPLLCDDKMRIGHTSPRVFMMPDGNEKAFGNVLWYTNLPVVRENALSPSKPYSPEAYMRFDNYDALNIDKVRDIPYDYDGVMGVPITYLYKHDPDRFRILGIASPIRSEIGVYPDKMYTGTEYHAPDGTVVRNTKINTRPVLLLDKPPKGGYYTADGVDGYLVNTYVRILIQRK